MPTQPIIRRTTFAGLDAIELRTASLRVVALTAKGPRLAFWGRPGGENLLLWKPGKYFRGDWELMGGHRLWAARPGADEAEETYATDNQPCAVKVSARGFTVTGALDLAQKTRRGLTVTATADGRITLDHFLREGDEGLAAARRRVEHHARQAIAGGLGQAHVARDDGVKHLVAEVVL